MNLDNSILENKNSELVLYTNDFDEMFEKITKQREKFNSRANEIF